jgi:hypothetical protein
VLDASRRRDGWHWACFPTPSPTEEKETTMVKQIQTPQSAKKSMSQGAASQGTAGSTRGAVSSSTGERDEIYGVVSVIYHALQGAETYQRYIDDAQKAGDGELQQFFETCRKEELERAKRAKSILLDRLEDEELEDEGDADEEEDSDEESSSEDEEE